MSDLITRQPKRLFTFGCSFTKYGWGTMWPEIVAYDLNVPYYNYGRTGAGNQYIANTMMQADNYYNFDSDDLVMVCWTNVCRFDVLKNKKWTCPGNIFSQDKYPKAVVEMIGDPEGLLLRDLSTIKLVNEFLLSKKVQYHFLSMLDIARFMNQWSADEHTSETSMLETFKPTMNTIKKSFYEVLWDNNLHTNKIGLEKKTLHSDFSDGHPFPNESLTYLERVFPAHTFNDTTKSEVNKRHNIITGYIRSHGNWDDSDKALYETSILKASERLLGIL